MSDTTSYPPRGLNREEAARYVGVGTTTFDALVQDGRMPRPMRLGKRGADLVAPDLRDGGFWRGKKRQGFRGKAVMNGEVVLR